MDPPPFPGGSTSTTVMTTPVPPPPGNNNHALSVDSSPRLRDDHHHHHHHQCSKLRLMCSYGGYIYPRPHDKCLSYIGGDTRMFVAERTISLSELSSRLSKTFLGGKKQFSLKYQLQNEDLDSLVSVTSDEDLENMIDEYDRINIKNSSSSKVSTRLRLFLFPSNNKSDHSWSSVKSEEWFVNVLNGGNSTTKLFSESSSVNCLLGLDDDVGNANVKEQVIKGSTHDVLPDSPMVETTSSTSFGSTSSMPALAPIRVHTEEKFSQMTLGGVKQKLEDGGFMAPTAVSGMPVVVAGPPQLQPKLAIPSDLPSPDSVSSEGSVTNPLSRQRHYFYQEPGVQNQSMSGGKVSSNSSSVDLKESDSSGMPQVKQQVQDGGGYALPVQHDQHQKMLQPQQYVHYIRQTPSGPVPMASYHPIYPSQHQTFPQHPVLEHQYPVYFIPGGPALGYSLPLPQTNVTEPAQIVPSTRLETPLHPTMATPAAANNAARNPPASKPEMVAGTYRTAAAAAPQFVQITSGLHQPQYVAYSQIQHTSQSIPPMSTTTANYTYDFADPTQAKMYYSQPLAPQLTSHYQNMTSFPVETSSQLPFENLKQQIRTSQTRNVSST